MIKAVPDAAHAQEIELNTGDFRASGAFAEGLLACAARAGAWLRRIRVVQAQPGRSGCVPKVVYGDRGTRLEMYKGAQVGGPPLWLLSCSRTQHVGEKVHRLRCGAST